MGLVLAVCPAGSCFFGVQAPRPADVLSVSSARAISRWFLATSGCWEV